MSELDPFISSPSDCWASGPDVGGVQFGKKLHRMLILMPAAILSFLLSEGWNKIKAADENWCTRLRKYLQLDKEPFIASMADPEETICYYWEISLISGWTAEHHIYKIILPSLINRNVSLAKTLPGCCYQFKKGWVWFMVQPFSSKGMYLTSLNKQKISLNSFLNPHETQLIGLVVETFENIKVVLV